MAYHSLIIPYLRHSPPPPPPCAACRPFRRRRRLCRACGSPPLGRLQPSPSARGTATLALPHARARISLKENRPRIRSLSVYPPNSPIRMGNVRSGRIAAVALHPHSRLPPRYFRFLPRHSRESGNPECRAPLPESGFIGFSGFSPPPRLCVSHSPHCAIASLRHCVNSPSDFSQRRPLAPSPQTHL